MVQRNIQLHYFLSQGNNLMSNKVTFPFFAVTISVSRDFYLVIFIFLFSTRLEMDGRSLCFWKPPLLNQNQLAVLEYGSNTQSETCALQSLASQDPVSGSAERQPLNSLPCCAFANCPSPPAKSFGAEIREEISPDKQNRDLSHSTLCNSTGCLRNAGVH